MNIEEAYDQYLLYAKTERGYAPETLIKIRDAFLSRLQPAFRGREVGSITRFDVLRFRNQLIEEKLSIARQYNLLMVLRLFLKFCRDLLKLACLDPAEVPLPRRQIPRVEFLTREEVQRVLDAAPVSTFTGLRLHVLLEVLLSTGLRISEALALDRVPFQLGQKEIEIIGKGGKRRTVFLTDRCILWGRKLLQARSDLHPALFITATEPPRRWQRNDVSRFFLELRQRAGIEKPLTPHILRHTYCTNLLHNGADITFIRDLAGHSDIRTTARYYLGVDRKALRRTVDQYLDYGLRDAA
jgi:site-specific recombinase XerD